MRVISRLAAAAAVIGAATSAPAQEFRPALIYDLGGKFDRSFNQASFEGAERFREETGISVREFEIQSDAQREQALLRFAKEGNNPIMVTGFAYERALAAAAREFSGTEFAIIDAVVELPNVRSVVFKEHEGSYLVGMLAAMKSQTGTIGFVGGVDIPLIQKFACGYAQGAVAANPDTKVLVSMAGASPAAFNNPVRGAELTKGLIGQGADVIYHAAGGTGRGVLQAAADAGVFGIGSDANQNDLHPGSVLTSMRKRVDVAVLSVLLAARGGRFAPGVVELGLAEGGVDYAVDDNNRALLTDEMIRRVEAAKAGIVSGEILVHDFTADYSCPVP